MLKKNILANLIGNFLTAIVYILCVPIYVKYLGVESYGLIGFFTSLQVIFSIMDMGLSATLNRQFARLSVTPDGFVEQKNLLRTLEYIYLGIAVFIGLIVFLFSSLISKHWLSAASITPETVHFVLIQMGILLALRFPSALYAGGLAGLQRQVVYNLVNTTGEVVKAVGSISVLMFFSNSIISFFYWQIIVSAIVLVLLRLITWNNIPSTPGRPSFSKALLKKNKSFAVGIGSTTLLVIILTQMDKIILSKILDLRTFGYFTMASAIASSLYRIITPVSQAMYPRLVQLVHSNNEAALIKFFHSACQLVAVFILPLALTVAFFSKEFIMIWTNDATITAAAYPLARILIIGTACNALVTIPYMLQLAYGWTKLGFYQNVVGIIILAPSLVYLTYYYGVSGAVWVWTILNASYIVFSIPIMFTKYLKTEKFTWYWNDMFYIVIMILVPGSLLRIIFNYLNFAGTWPVIIYCFIAYIILLASAVFSVKYTREYIVNLFALKILKNSHQ